MKSRINQILSDIKNKKEELKQDLVLEYEKLKEKYWFTIKWRKITFDSDVKKINKKHKRWLIETIFNAKVRELLSIPFIYSVIIPALILDLFITIYQFFAFRLYKIPRVKRKDYIFYDRWELDYLNIFQKLNCHYCSYVNWLFWYAVEIAWRTERYWCPIKSSQKLKWGHDWQEYFADYWDPNWFKATFCSMNVEKDFKKVK